MKLKSFRDILFIFALLTLMPIVSSAATGRKLISSIGLGKAEAGIRVLRASGSTTLSGFFSIGDYLREKNLLSEMQDYTNWSFLPYGATVSLAFSEKAFLSGIFFTYSPVLFDLYTLSSLTDTQGVKFGIWRSFGKPTGRLKISFSGLYADQDVFNDFSTVDVGSFATGVSFSKKEWTFYTGIYQFGITHGNDVEGYLTVHTDIKIHHLFKKSAFFMIGLERRLSGTIINDRILAQNETRFIFDTGVE